LKIAKPTVVYCCLHNAKFIISSPPYAFKKLDKKDLGCKSEIVFSTSAPPLLLLFVIHSLGLRSYLFAIMRDTFFKMKKTIYINLIEAKILVCNSLSI